MSLSTLVGGADCGPSNPLQSLAKRFDQDRAQQDVGSSTRSVASSGEAQFRSQHAPMPGELQREAARFFSVEPAQPRQMPVEPASASLLTSSMRMESMRMGSMPVFEVAGLRDALPVVETGWAADFLSKQPATVQTPIQGTRVDRDRQVQGAFVGDVRGGMLPWSTAVAGHGMNVTPGMTNAMAVPARHVVQSDQTAWDREFESQASLLKPDVPAASEALPEQQQGLQDRTGVPADDMARIAAQVVDAVKHEQNPKFRESRFMDLMRQLRDGDVTVREDGIVPKAGDATTTPVDVKGKGRADDVVGLSSMSFRPSGGAGSQGQVDQGDPHEAYFRQENADYAAYWNAHDVPASTARGSTEWDRMQRDWDAFEATTAGVKPVANYQFQADNPYLLGNASARTRHHGVHMSQSQRAYENVLELEAAVLRDPTNAAAWFELGVKQQENEREAKAIQALERAVELDPSHLATWLAVAVSYTNDGNRLETCYAIRQWMLRNATYAGVVSGPLTGGVDELIGVLIRMARHGPERSGGVDADVQVALAVLLNVAEDYGKAVDCFLAALAVRPDDWLLYNRVGATMANSGRTDEALEYYHRALELNPGYIRARFNLGISCINLRRYDEAASHILDALVLQDSDGVQDGAGMNDARGVTSSALWESLKTTCLQLRRAELAALCDARDVDGFRRAFYGA